MKNEPISAAVRCIGAFDADLDLFEGQYPIPEGVSYNSYLIVDEKIAVMDTVDARGTTAWLQNLETELQGRVPDYLVTLHMEPDHAANLANLAARYPEMQIVGNAKTFVQMKQFFGAETIAESRYITVKEGDTLSLGAHTLHFVMAPMVHWPEVMVAYESYEKILFSADGFGRFGSTNPADPWTENARRYYLNIVGKYGAQVQALLKKAAGLDIQTICPLHGPVLQGDLETYLALYDTWSSYRPEAPDAVLVAYASIHGNTKKAAQHFAKLLRAQNISVTEMDLTRTDVSYAVAEAFRCGKLVLACATYDGGLFPAMETFLAHLKSKNFQKRTIGLLENGTWAPMAAKCMRAELETMKEMQICDTVVTIRSAMHPENETQMQTLITELQA